MRYYLKAIIVLFFLTNSNALISQNKSIDNWIQDVVSDMIEMNDLVKYSSIEISPNISVNFIMVESVKDITVNDSIISMLVNHGKGTYCTQIKFEYVKKDGDFYLVFAKPETKITLGQERRWVKPWIEKKNICN